MSNVKDLRIQRAHVHAVLQASYCCFSVLVTVKSHTTFVPIHESSVVVLIAPLLHTVHRPNSRPLPVWDISAWAFV